MIKRLFSPKHTPIRPIEQYRFNGMFFERKRPPYRKIAAALFVFSSICMTNTIAVSGYTHAPSDEVRYTPTVLDKAVAYMMGVNKALDYQQAYEIAVHVQENSRDLRIDPNLLLAMCQRESSFKANSVSKAGAMGLCQIMPQAHTARILEARERFGEETNLFTPKVNLWISARIFKHYLSLQGGNVSKALSQYEGSLTKSIPTTYPSEVLSLKAKLDRILEWKQS